MAGTHTASTERPPRVYVVVLNWNGWGDTLRCLESVLRLDYPDFRVLVCDNASGDGSVGCIRAWAAGALDALPPPAPGPRSCAWPPLAKPLALHELTRAEAQRCAGEQPDAPLVLIRTGGNLGYAGGNNVALRYALARGDADYVWLLNNDTVVRPDALAALVRRMAQRPQAGLCGSLLCDYHRPGRVQALGGARFNPWLGSQRALGAGARADAAVDAAAVERRLDYVIGASMLVSRRWLETVGLLCEDYFLYFEEIDWAVRGRGRLALAFAPDSVVYHREGAATGRPARAAAADCLALSNRLRFTRNHRPWALPTVWLGFLLVLANRLRRGQRERLRPILAIMLGRRPAAGRPGG